MVFPVCAFVSAVVSSKSLTSLSSASSADIEGPAPTQVALTIDVVWMSETGDIFLYQHENERPYKIARARRTSV